MFVFAVLVIVIFNFAFEASRDEIILIGPGILWVAFTFAGTLGLNHSFAMERDDGCLQGIMLTPIDAGEIYLGKALGNAIFMLTVEVMILPVFSILFNLPLLHLDRLMAIILAGTLGFAGVGTIIAAVTANTKMREVLLPIMLFPLIVPLFIAVVEGTSAVLQNAEPAAFNNWLRVAVSFDVVFMVVSYWIFGFVLEE